MLRGNSSRRFNSPWGTIKRDEHPAEFPLYVSSKREVIREKNFTSTPLSSRLRVHPFFYGLRYLSFFFLFLFFKLSKRFNIAHAWRSNCNLSFMYFNLIVLFPIPSHFSIDKKFPTIKGWERIWKFHAGEFFKTWKITFVGRDERQIEMYTEFTNCSSICLICKISCKKKILFACSIRLIYSPSP